MMNPVALKLAQAPQSARTVQQPNVEITLGDPSMGIGIDVGVARGGYAYLRVFNATPDELVIVAHGLPAHWVRVDGQLGNAVYDMTIRAAAPYTAQTVAAVDEEIESVCRVKIQQYISIRDVYLLKAIDKNKTLPWAILPNPLRHSYPYRLGELELHFTRDSLDTVADALEQVLNTPVLDESGVAGRLTADLRFIAADFGPVKTALEERTGFTLIPGRRPVETVSITPDPGP